MLMAQSLRVSEATVKSVNEVNSKVGHEIVIPVVAGSRPVSRPTLLKAFRPFFSSFNYWVIPIRVFLYINFGYFDILNL